MLDGVTLSLICLCLTWQLVLGGVALGVGTLIGDAFPIVSLSGERTPPSRPHCLRPAGQTPGACLAGPWWAGSQPLSGQRQWDLGEMDYVLASLGTSISHGFTWPERACLSPAARGQSCPGH